MMSLFGRVISDTSVTQGDFSNQAKFLQQLQRPVNRGNIGIWILGPNLDIDLVSTDMLVTTVKSLNDHHSLWR